MKEQILIWIKKSWVVLGYSKFMGWNLFLAIVPLILSILLFRTNIKPSGIWWVGFLVFIVFLPNAPYVLTDVIHLINFVRAGLSVWTVTLVLIPQYSLFILAGFEAYVISLINLGHYLHQQNLSKYILPVELITHALCAVGIYLGRFERFNSWDFVTQPKTLGRSVLDNFTSKQPLLVTLITFLVLVLLYWIVKEINLALMMRINEKSS